MYIRYHPRSIQAKNYIRGYLWHRYSIVINQVMVTTVKLSKWWIKLSQEELNQASIKEYRINWDIYTPYVGAAGKLLHINGKFTMGKLKLQFWLTSYLLCLVNVFFNGQSAYLWEQTELLFSLTCSFIGMRQILYRGFSRKVPSYNKVSVCTLVSPFYEA
jgi:hypothetical protein